MHTIEIPVNYEDTDAAGVVYYANYLAYMERARNSMLRAMGFPLSRLVVDPGILFVVKEASLHYHAPAVLDDIIAVASLVEKVSGATIRFHHRVRRGSELLVSADIRLVTIDSKRLRPTRVPRMLVDGWNA